MKAVAVTGASDCSEEEARLAYEVGRLLAQRGVVVVCGGRGGVMEAACQGAVEAGGFTVGILPGTDPTSGNPYLSFSLPTGLGHARNALVAQAGTAMIAIGGGSGTLSELALAVAHGRPVIGLETWHAQHADGGELPVIMAQSPEQAVELAVD